MDSGAIVALLIGLAMLAGPTVVLWLVGRRWLRVATWPRTQGTIRHVWKSKSSTMVTGAVTSETSIHARYVFRDSSGREHTGECEYLKDPKVGDLLEIMHAPGIPANNQPVYGGSVVGRIVVLGFVVIFFGGLGLFMVLAALGAVSI